MEEKNCPVCGKPVGDYLKDNIRCASCGSNLEVYRLLYEVDKSIVETGVKWKPVAIVTSILALVFALLYFLTPKTVKSPDSELLVQLEDSVAALNEQIKQLKPETAVAKVETKADVKKADEKADVKADETKDEDKKSDEKKAEEKKQEEVKADLGKVVVRDGKKYYVVEPGDSWWKVCKKVYGADKVDYHEIAKLNNKPIDYKMQVGEYIQVK